MSAKDIPGGKVMAADAGSGTRNEMDGIRKNNAMHAVIQTGKYMHGLNPGVIEK